MAGPLLDPGALVTVETVLLALELSCNMRNKDQESHHELPILIVFGMAIEMEHFDLRVLTKGNRASQ